MDILVIGGTRFVGRAFVEASLEKGHTVTLFNRGQSNPDLFPQVEQITGDRDGGLSALGDRTWDAVVDTCGYVPRIVQQSADYLKDRVQRYCFISTISVYDTDQMLPESGESAPLSAMPDDVDPETEEITGQTYGPLKVLCEQVVQEAYSDSALIVRPGLIVGPHDPTNRFTYWTTRIRQGGAVLAPGGPEYPTQFIDVRDLASWLLVLLEWKQTGVFNATGPTYNLLLRDCFRTMREVTESDASFVWADDDFLREHEVAPFMEMPLWVPMPLAERMMTVSIQKSIEHGLTCRPLTQTIQDTLAWVDSLEGSQPGDGGMSPEREAELLQALQNAD